VAADVIVPRSGHDRGIARLAPVAFGLAAVATSALAHDSMILPESAQAFPSGTRLPVAVVVVRVVEAVVP
jgi:hypothetical protein